RGGEGVAHGVLRWWGSVVALAGREFVHDASRALVEPQIAGEELVVRRARVGVGHDPVYDRVPVLDARPVALVADGGCRQERGAVAGADGGRGYFLHQARGVRDDLQPEPALCAAADSD